MNSLDTYYRNQDAENERRAAQTVRIAKVKAQAKADNIKELMRSQIIPRILASAETKHPPVEKLRLILPYIRNDCYMHNKDWQEYFGWLINIQFHEYDMSTWSRGLYLLTGGSLVRTESGRIEVSMVIPSMFRNNYNLSKYPAILISDDELAWACQELLSSARTTFSIPDSEVARWEKIRREITNEI